MIVRKLRLQKCWSQEQLAQLSGLSIRTIQRIERGQKAGLESLKSLAAVFEVSVTDLQKEPEMSNENKSYSTQKFTNEEQEALEYVRDLKGFYANLITYVGVIILLFVINITTNPEYIWAWWPALGWGVGVISHGLNVFEVVNFFGPNWEKKQVEKRLAKKL